MYVYEERERERQRQRYRDRERQRDRDRERQRERDTRGSMNGLGSSHPRVLGLPKYPWGNGFQQCRVEVKLATDSREDNADMAWMCLLGP